MELCARVFWIICQVCGWIEADVEEEERGRPSKQEGKDSMRESIVGYIYLYKLTTYIWGGELNSVPTNLRNLTNN